jgi:hypothetical protein
MKKKYIYFGISVAISMVLLILTFVLMNKIANEIIKLEGFGENSSEEVCNLSSGKWLPESKECEGISKVQCEQSGGTFEECASACRHNPDAEFCIAMCVPVCKY